MNVEDAQPIDIALVMAGALRAAKRRERMGKQAISCPSCGSLQVQLVDGRPPASWKCRNCRHKFLHEPLVKHEEIE